MLQASLEVYHAMAKAVSPTEMARVLLLLEKLLGRGGLLRAAWAQHWQASWQRAASYCVDWKHALLLAAALQVRPAALSLSCHTPSRGVSSASIPAADSTLQGVHCASSGNHCTSHSMSPGSMPCSSQVLYRCGFVPLLLTAMHWLLCTSVPLPQSYPPMSPHAHRHITGSV